MINQIFLSGIYNLVNLFYRYVHIDYLFVIVCSSKNTFFIEQYPTQCPTMLIIGICDTLPIVRQPSFLHEVYFINWNLDKKGYALCNNFERRYHEDFHFSNSPWRNTVRLVGINWRPSTPAGEYELYRVSARSGKSLGILIEP